jgi:hypothetical protein
MALNHDLEVDRVEPATRRAFLGRPEKMLLKPGVGLYRWSRRPITNAGPVSPWWSFVESTRLPSGALAEGFRVSHERAQRIGSTHRDFAQRRAAISQEFGNTMTNLLFRRLITDAWCLAGQASGQPEFARDRRDLQNVFLIGGAWQVWIPNLDVGRHLQEIPAPG